MKKAVLAVPVYNGEQVLEGTIETLNHYLEGKPYESSIVISDNASTDRTPEIAERLAGRMKKVKHIYLPKKGRGNALMAAWTSDDADAYGYCDVDLATDISHIDELFGSIFDGYDLAVGSRYMKDSEAERSLSRLFMSKVFNMYVKIFFRTKITDLQCGFKAISNNTKNLILPLVRDRDWFFDTELLILSEWNNLQIKQIPVRWKEFGDTRVKFTKTIIDYVKNTILLRQRIK